MSLQVIRFVSINSPMTSFSKRCAPGPATGGSWPARSAGPPAAASDAGTVVGTEGSAHEPRRRAGGAAVLAGLALLLLAVTGCASTVTHPAVAERNAVIATEPRGNYFIGRRYHIPRTHIWGYVRRPGQPWDRARLVIMDESIRTQPDRIPEVRADDGPVHGYDHNFEYRLTGSLTGQRLYDPNSNMFLESFRLTGYELINPSPGFIFHPNESRDQSRLPRAEPYDTGPP